MAKSLTNQKNFKPHNVYNVFRVHRLYKSPETPLLIAARRIEDIQQT